MRIIPAIDIIDGKCVRLTQGNYEDKKIYSDDPLQVAQEYEEAGIQYLHLVDLDGAKAKKIVNWKVLERICTHTQLKVDFGGGLKSLEDIQLAFDCGAQQITGGSVAVKNRDLFLECLKKYGTDKIILGADVKDEKIAVSGWHELTQLALIPFLEGYVAEGVQHVICTDIQKDGLLQGPSIELYQKILAKFPTLELIASGGVSNMQDIEQLDQAGIPGVIIGKALYESRITLHELKAYL